MLSSVGGKKLPELHIYHSLYAIPPRPFCRGTHPPVSVGARNVPIDDYDCSMAYGRAMDRIESHYAQLIDDNRGMHLGIPAAQTHVLSGLSLSEGPKSKVSEACMQGGPPQ